MWTVIGHERAVALLRRSLERGVTSHAYLLVGPPHVGKTTLAVNLAQALNCEAADRPCGVCDPCRRIAAGKHADVQVTKLEAGAEGAETPARTRISVEQVDQILHSVNLPPFEGRCKVFIIDEFENTSIQAANRLLKTLEEPVSPVVFILLTANEEQVPATIVSRCQRVELFPLSRTLVEEALIERWRVPPGRARLLARLSEGRLGLAVNMAADEDQLRQRNEWLDEWLHVLDSNLDERFVFAARVTERYTQNRQPLHERLALLKLWWRDLLLVKTGNGDMMTSTDREDALRGVSAGLAVRQIRDFIGDIQAAESQLRKNVNPQLAVEALMLKAPEAGK